MLQAAVHTGTAMSDTASNLVSVMRSLGIGDDQLSEWLYEKRPDIYLGPILKTLPTDPAFLKRLTASVSYDEPSSFENRRNANPLEFLDDIFAIQLDTPSLCKKISPNAEAQESGGHFSLRNACFSNIAFNRKDDSLCHEIVPTTNTEQTNQ